MMTIRQLDPSVKRALQERARRHGRSMEAEAREILTAAVAAVDEPEGLGQAILREFADVDTEDIPAFGEDRRPPRLVEL
ncbi:FitA-like ribbon-helix-helix domain-containing protein [Ruania rhizosphaerae]|uniref:FitA-like ribbon-helix-helix domain-containing protein n=1 Tax=Ruania rhizosphaerae TaxID=1840413 RepID=UPI001F2C5610|nr:toxin-antitoxin system [Ruania rhizosphaerae]